MTAFPCRDCGTPIGPDDSSYAVDCGEVCIPCGETRYGEDITKYFIAATNPPPAGTQSCRLWLETLPPDQAAEISAVIASITAKETSR
jgi:hypothetical protein